ncbi:uncharacterized protein M421DRAFT_102264 [Didymella exigua CBS 183.55]|uniref:Uncharacterized protein n=1 Tax=Didymella exigua CBS 183.55 TaxID=1150837 RepID=A0A6A5RH84_9PLEO|nr:uncharacterized protein M421DRAFT_102264 [Didymella exigua CBS 183.55]KAF1926863.1 hypothetical protein M421DRAFT_102264 [Didymella exigua CBS 183.55]
MEQPTTERQWSEHEKIYLLAEILKAAPVSSHVLYSFIREYQVQVRWNDMALPPGRSLNSCQRAYHDIANSNSGASYSRPPLPTPNMYPGSDLTRKRPLQEAAPLGRLLQPRPPPHPYATEYLSAGGPAYAKSMNAGEPANKKKRGRPTKAEAQQRAQEAAARGEVYPPPRRGRQSITAHPEPSSSGPSPEQLPQAHTPPQTSTRVLPTNTVTPQHQLHNEQSSESSSGKRRRARPQPLELEKVQRQSSEMQSPHAYGSADPTRNHTYSSFTPISAPLPSSAGSRDRDTRMEGIEEAQPRTTTPHSFKDTVGI